MSNEYFSKSSSQVSPLIPDDESGYGDEDEKMERCPFKCPSFNNPITGCTRPAYLFPLFVIINILTMIDRSIISGASLEFSAFFSSARDSPPAVKENPDVGIGLVQATFVFGYILSLLMCGHYVHKFRWKTIVVATYCVSLLGVLGSGKAKQYNSFYVLLFSRMVTGCRDAAFQVVAPPLIQDRGGKHSGLWLSIYLTGLPIGLTTGYIYGSFIASSDQWGWNWAYYIMCIISLPPLIVLIFVKDEINGGILGRAGEITGASCGDETLAHEPLLAVSRDEDEINTENTNEEETYTLFTELNACLSSPVLVAVSLGWAAIIGTCASISIFGVSIVVALGLFDNERKAASWFGGLAALAGIIGTPLGGKIVDNVVEKYIGRTNYAKRGEGVDDAFRHPICANILSRVNVLLAASLMFVFPTVVVHEAFLFLMLQFIGWILLFMTSTGISLIVMLSVDRCYRPNASAFLMLTSHLLGDGPLPMVLGFIKDKLAPACRVGSSGDFVDPEQCIEQDVGVRKSLAIAYSWVLLALVCFEVARQFARREAKRLGRREARRSIRCFWRDTKELQ